MIEARVLTDDIHNSNHFNEFEVVPYSSPKALSAALCHHTQGMRSVLESTDADQIFPRGKVSAEDSSYSCSTLSALNPEDQPTWGTFIPEDESKYEEKPQRKAPKLLSFLKKRKGKAKRQFPIDCESPVAVVTYAPESQRFGPVPYITRQISDIGTESVDSKSRKSAELDSLFSSALDFAREKEEQKMAVYHKKEANIIIINAKAKQEQRQKEQQLIAKYAKVKKERRKKKRAQTESREDMKQNTAIFSFLNCK